MKARWILAPLIALPFTLFGAIPNKALEDYKEGVYNTTSLINKQLREGLQETILDQYQGKYLVVANLDKMNLVDIIFYENIAQQQQILDVKTAKRVSSGENFIVFGAFERKADASMIQDRLADSGVETEVVYNSDPKNGYMQNPIIVKKYLGDIRELIKDMPVRVVKIERTILKDGGEVKCPVQPMVRLPETMSNFPSLAIEEEFHRLEDAWVKGGETGGKPFNYIAIKRVSGFLIGKKNYYVIGEKIGCFVLKNIIHNDYANTDSIILLGADQREYVATKPSYSAHVKAITTPVPAKSYPKKIVVPKIKDVSKKTITCSSGATTLDGGFCPKEGDAKSKANTNANSGTNDYQCDFSKISLLKIGDKSMKTTSTPYSGIENVVLTHKDGSYSYVKGAGKPEIAIPLNTFSSKCSGGVL
ncbi:MAG: hypothetical protein PHT07_10635 [Paludibacter sp.]|nr:hypothetical protein [Paludibacter sp.]